MGRTRETGVIRPDGHFNFVQYTLVIIPVFKTKKGDRRKKNIQGAAVGYIGEPCPDGRTSCAGPVKLDCPEILRLMDKGLWLSTQPFLQDQEENTPGIR